jgi:hypothetical protein
MSTPSNVNETLEKHAARLLRAARVETDMGKLSPLKPLWSDPRMQRR